MAKKKTKRKSTTGRSTTRTTKGTTKKKATARKTTTKRASARTASSKRGTTRKTATTRRTTATTKTNLVAGTGKIPTFKEPASKSTMIKAITEATGLGKKDVTSVLEYLGQVIEKHVKPGGPGKFVLPGLMKVTVVKKPARPARKGINPFTGEEIMIKAKKASKAVKIRPLKKLKEMVTN